MSVPAKREEERAKLLAARHRSETDIYGGEAKVYKAHDMYILFEVVKEGAKPKYYATYPEMSIDNLLKTVEGWEGWA